MQAFIVKRGPRPLSCYGCSRRLLVGEKAWVTESLKEHGPIFCIGCGDHKETPNQSG